MFSNDDGLALFFPDLTRCRCVEESTRMPTTTQGTQLKRSKFGVDSVLLLELLRAAGRDLGNAVLPGPTIDP
jgi:hypothetical protein